MRKSGIEKGGQPFVYGSRVVSQSFLPPYQSPQAAKKQLCNSIVGNGCQDDKGICKVGLSNGVSMVGLPTFDESCLIACSHVSHLAASLAI
jgi:hypothetical protein